MKIPLLGYVLVAATLFAAQASAQSAPPATSPSYHQTIQRIKVAPGHGGEFVQLLRDTNMKVWQARADKGQIVSWTLLRTVVPAGEESRANYLISILYDGLPPGPDEGRAFAADLKTVGVTLSLAEINTRRDAISKHVATELWRVEARVGALKKGHFLYINYMAAPDGAAYHEFETNVWRPVAERAVQNGVMSGWLYASKLLPYGSNTGEHYYTADMFPTWEAAFAPRSMGQLFESVHPGMNLAEIGERMDKLRTITRGELWMVVERVEKAAR